MGTKYPWWERFLKEGAELFTYMKENYGAMFENQNILHFCIISGDFRATLSDIDDSYIDAIEKELISWINREKDNGRLFESNNWTPFSDPETVFDMFLGYRYMFVYTIKNKQYYFQLILDKYCIDCDYCERDGDGAIHFSLAYYGWNDGTQTKLQPYNTYEIKEDNMIPEKYWHI